jgi:hypothetical protein
MLLFNDWVTALEHVEITGSLVFCINTIFLNLILMIYIQEIRLSDVLPRRQLTNKELADIICKRHYLHRKARESHAKRTHVARE